MSWLIRLDWMKALFARLAKGVYPIFPNDTLQRVAAMYSTGNASSQEVILHGIQKQYPHDACFVVLPMNLEHVGLSRVAQSIDTQHAQLLRLAQADARVIPFYAVDPRQPDIVEQVRQNVGPGK